MAGDEYWEAKGAIAWLPMIKYVVDEAVQEGIVKPEERFLAENLLLGVVGVESAGNPGTRQHHGWESSSTGLGDASSEGLTQVIFHHQYADENPYDPLTNLRQGLRTLWSYYRTYGNRWDLALMEHLTGDVSNPAKIDDLGQMQGGAYKGRVLQIVRKARELLGEGPVTDYKNIPHASQAFDWTPPWTSRAYTGLTGDTRGEDPQYYARAKAAGVNVQLGHLWRDRVGSFDPLDPIMTMPLPGPVWRPDRQEKPYDPNHAPKVVAKGGKVQTMKTKINVPTPRRGTVASMGSPAESRFGWDVSTASASTGASPMPEVLPYRRVRREEMGSVPVQNATLSLLSSQSVLNQQTSAPMVLPERLLNVTDNTFVPPLKTQGKYIIDARGQPVKLVSVALLGMGTGVPFNSWREGNSIEETLSAIKRNGYNSIRLPIALDTYMYPGKPPWMNTSDLLVSNPGLGPNATPVQVLDHLLDVAARLGLGVVLDMHDIPHDSWTSPLWYNSTEKDTGNRFYGVNDPRNIWTGKANEKDMIRAWQVLAERYKNHPAVIGADLFNEPHEPATWGDGGPTDWRRGAEAIGSALQQIAPHWLIIVEGIGADRKTNNLGDAWWGGNLNNVAKAPVRLQNVVYSPHDYSASVWGNWWLDHPTAMRELWERSWGYIARNNIAPIWIGEFGDRSVDPNTSGGRQMHMLLDYLDEIGGHWSYWAWHDESSGDTGGLVPAGAKDPMPQKQALLSKFQKLTPDWGQGKNVAKSGYVPEWQPFDPSRPGFPPLPGVPIVSAPGVVGATATAQTGQPQGQENLPSISGGLPQTGVFQSAAPTLPTTGELKTGEGAKIVEEAVSRAGELATKRQRPLYAQPSPTLPSSATEFPSPAEQGLGQNLFSMPLSPLYKRVSSPTKQKQKEERGVLPLPSWGFQPSSSAAGMPLPPPPLTGFTTSLPTRGIFNFSENKSPLSSLIANDYARRLLGGR